MATHLKLITPTTVKRTVPIRRPNAELRTREHLTQAEVDRLIEAAKGNRQGHRDATMILIAFGMAYVPASWLTFVGIRWTSTALVLHVRRVKAGTPARIH